MKALAFILIAIGTIGLLVVEFTEAARYLTLTFAGCNVVGLITLVLTTCKKSEV